MIAFAVVLQDWAGTQDALDPAGPMARAIATHSWSMIWLLSGVAVVTAAALLYAVLHRGRRGGTTGDDRATRWVAGATGATVLILLGLLFTDLAVGRGIMHVHETDALVIDVTGKQWWWQVDYHSPTPSERVTTANEIHIPVGEKVMLRLRSTDVIHSIWVPRLQGKRDLVPGHETVLWLEADEPGEYRGECAEFCGHQHAKMALWVIAEPRPQFERWYRAQLRPADPPPDSLAAEGEDVFTAKTCIMCHTIRGTPAGGKLGPDLTHLASRKTIAAGTLTNTRGNLAGWIMDPQGIKPGAKMPSHDLTPDELEALLHYLGGLR